MHAHCEVHEIEEVKRVEGGFRQEQPILRLEQKQEVKSLPKPRFRGVLGPRPAPAQKK